MDSLKRSTFANNSTKISKEADSLINILKKHKSLIDSSKNPNGKKLENISPSGWITDYYFFGNNKFIIVNKQDALLVC